MTKNYMKWCFKVFKGVPSSSCRVFSCWPTIIASSVRLIIEAVCPRWMKDGDAHTSVRIDVWMPHLCFKPRMELRVIAELESLLELRKLEQAAVWVDSTP